jgi:hypothetical protein
MRRLMPETELPDSGPVPDRQPGARGRGTPILSAAGQTTNEEDVQRWVQKILADNVQDLPIRIVFCDTGNPRFHDDEAYVIYVDHIRNGDKIQIEQGAFANMSMDKFLVLVQWNRALGELLRRKVQKVWIDWCVLDGGDRGRADDADDRIDDSSESRLTDNERLRGLKGLLARGGYILAVTENAYQAVAAASRIQGVIDGGGRETVLNTHAWESMNEHFRVEILSHQTMEHRDAAWLFAENATRGASGLWKLYPESVYREVMALQGGEQRTRMQFYGLDENVLQFLRDAYCCIDRDSFCRVITGGSAEVKVKRLLPRKVTKTIDEALRYRDERLGIATLRRAGFSTASGPMRTAMSRLRNGELGRVTPEEVDFARRIYRDGIPEDEDIAAVKRLVAITGDVERGGDLVPDAVRDAYRRITRTCLLLTPKTTEHTPGPRRFAPVHPSSTWQSDCEVG